jgi:ACS family glucarate transporter-like MFS transporter
MSASPTPSTSVRPTNVRFGVLGFTCVLSMVTYLDRVCFGAAATSIMRALSLTSDADFTWFMWAFALSYAAFEVPTGWLGDVFGPKKTLIRIVLWWSFFTVLTGMVGMEIGGAVFGGFGTMLVIRFLFGMGEAGAYPNITRALHNWFPYHERAMAQGAIWMSGRLMGGLTPMVWWLVTEQMELSWRQAFFLFGGLGVIWCFAFGARFKNWPREKPTVNEAELELIQEGRRDTEAAHARVPWGKLLSSGNLWFLCLMYFCAAYGWYFNISLLPRFLETQHGVHPSSFWGAVYKGGPLWMGAITCLVGGYLSDRFIRKTGNRKWGRRLFGVIGHGLCAVCYFACLTAPNAFTFFLFISLAAFWNDLTMGAAWATCQDIGRRYAAIVAGCMNTIGNLGGAVTMLVTGYILNSTLEAHAASQNVSVSALSETAKAEGLFPGYQINFFIYGCVYLVAVLLWLRVDATKPILPEGDNQPPTDPAQNAT